MFPTLKKLLDSFLAMGLPGYDLILYQDGQCIWRSQDGYADAETRKPLSGQELYNIYSCSKVITVTAAMQLYEQKRFSLEDPLFLYLPEFARMQVQTDEGTLPAKNPILIQDLFCMTAGFTYELSTPALKQCALDTNGRCPTRETMKYLAQEPLAFEPGTYWRYSLCHDVLAALVEVLSGEHFEDYVQHHIFEPLQMTHSTFLLPDEQRSRLTPQYTFDSAQQRAVNCGTGNRYVLGSEYASGGAGCVTTVEDYIRLAEALRIGDVILGADTIRLMTTDRLTPQTRPGYSPALKESHGYGLGLRCGRAGGQYQDFGWGGAAGAFLAIDPAENLSLFYAQHMLSSPHQVLRNQFIDCIHQDLHPGKTSVRHSQAENGCTY